MTLLLGIGSSAAIKAALLLLLVHALYKATLFLVAGLVDHATGTRDLTLLGGLHAAMPVTAAVAALAIAALRIDLIRVRYAVAAVMEQEEALLEEQRSLIVRRRQLRDPVELAVRARRIGRWRREGRCVSGRGQRPCAMPPVMPSEQSICRGAHADGRSGSRARLRTGAACEGAQAFDDATQS